jgi:hypothetical protein
MTDMIDAEIEMIIMEEVHDTVIDVHLLHITDDAVMNVPDHAVILLVVIKLRGGTAFIGEIIP